MPFDLNLWKEKTKQNLQGWKQRLDQAGTGSIYFFLAATSFLPVVQAVHAGDWSALAVLGTALGGAVGTNLLANMVQKLKDKSDTEVAEGLAAEARTNPELKAAIDALLEKLETLTDAEQALAEADKAWFEKTIQNELKQIGSGVKYEATLIGDGAIAQGPGAVAVGKGGVIVNGDVTGNVVTGDGNKIAETIIEHQVVHRAPDPRRTGREKAAETRENYLKQLHRHCQSLPLVALGDDPNAREDVVLDDVYIALHTTAMTDAKGIRIIDTEGHLNQLSKMLGKKDGENQKPLPAFDAFLQTPKMVLLGDPGSGKSTFVRNLLAMQAQVMLGRRKEPLNGIPDNLLPVLVTLRDLIPGLMNLECEKCSAERRDTLLVDVVDKQILSDLEQIYHSPEFRDGMRKSLADGNILLAFDGLDEVPEHLREKVRLAVTAYQEAYDLPRIIITCRVRSYTGPAEQPGFTRFTLAPFTREQVQTFCQAWYHSQVRLGKMDVSSAEEHAADLARAAWREDLRRLSENPMLLTTMAIIHHKETRLPNERVKLYSLAVRVLIERWQKHRFGEQLAVSDELAVVLKDEKRVRKILERLAYEAHRIGKENDRKNEADLLRKDALEILEGSPYLGNMVLAGEFLDYVDLRSGLLVGRGGEPGKPSVYSFAHRTFQEYLAGCYLINQRDAVRVLLAHAIEPEYWSLAVEFGAEDLYYNGRTESQNDVLDLAYALLAEKCKSVEHCRAALWSAKMAALVGTDAIETDSSLQGGRTYLTRLLSTALWLLESDLTPVERADAGRALAKIGDPRLEVLTCEQMAFCHVPVGEFIYGERKEQKKIRLDEFMIGKYPVTNAQFAQFVTAGGYADKMFWPEAAAEKYWSKKGFKGRFDDEYRMDAIDFGEPFNLPNHPVVGVSWYEALAFTRWLSGRMPGICRQWTVGAGSAELLEQAGAGGLHITLPSEEQWEKAARGTDGQIYPWGKEANPNLANYDDTGIGSTSAVGCFPGGVSPFGLLDASGNVWEWTAPETNDGQARVLRGGAFFVGAVGLRCAGRGRNFPSFRDDFVGFRVVVTRASLLSL